MESLIYIETTIPSFYSETRTDDETSIRRKWTRQWWDGPKPNQRLVTSWVVMNELMAIPMEARREESLGLVRGLEQLPHSEEVAELSNLYIARKLMPRELLGDADHLALASFHRCAMLLTWNCRHLANANKIAQIRRINALMDLPTPQLITPLELLNTP